MNKTYVPLEPSYTSLLGEQAKAPTFKTGDAAELFTSTSFLYSLAIMAIIVVAGWRYLLAGAWRMQASAGGIAKSNEEIRRVTLGLLGVLSMFTLLYTFNKGLLRGDVGLGGLKASNIVSGTGGDFGGGGAAGDTGGGAARTCAPKEDVIRSLSSSGGICGSTSCTVLTGCNYRPHLTLINSEASRQGVDAKLVIAIMCTESRGRADAKNKNPNGSWDCGIMQINQPGECTAASFDPTTNIPAGVAHIKRVMGSARQVYTNIPQTAGIAATYNCCANGTIPNDPSGDCTVSSGFPFSIPKWACPINPGEGEYNMCSVKSYGCGVDACVRQLSGVSL